MILLMLAEAAAPPVDMASVTPFVASISSLGFAIWFAYYTVSVTLPNQQKEHREERSQIRCELIETIDKLVSEMKNQREAFDRWKSEHKG